MSLPDKPRAQQYLERETPAIEQAQRDRAELANMILGAFYRYEQAYGRQALLDLIKSWPEQK